MAPGGSAKMSGVVIGVSRPGKTVIRDFVPFFAGDLARFATDAYRRIGGEPYVDIFLHVIVPTLVRTVRAFADHKIGSSRSITPGALILFLPSRDRRRAHSRRGAVPRDVERSVLSGVRVCLGTRRTHGRAAIGPAQYCKCTPWLP